MKRIIYILLLIPILLSAQEDDAFLTDSDLLLNKNKQKQSLIKDLKINYLAGANTSFSGFGGNSINTFVAPVLTMPVNKRLSISAGVLYNQSFVNNYKMPVFYGNENNLNFNGNLSQTIMFASFAYKLTDNIILTGSMSKSKVLNNQIKVNGKSQLNPNAFNLESSNYSFGLMIKTGEHSSLNLQFDFNQGGYPYGQMYSSPFNSPFQQHNGNMMFFH